MKPKDTYLRIYGKKDPLDLQALDQYRDLKLTSANKIGTVPFLCEGITGEWEFPIRQDQTIQIWPLDGNGKRMPEFAGDPIIPQHIAGQKTIIELSSKYKTLWYEIRIRNH